MTPIVGAGEEDDSKGGETSGQLAFAITLAASSASAIQTRTGRRTDTSVKAMLNYKNKS